MESFGRKRVKLLEVGDVENQVGGMDDTEKILQEPHIFLLNNLLMSIQFFENYEKDIEKLRENWFKEVPLEPYHKKCFFADSLFRLADVNVKFSPRHGVNKNLERPLHPVRIYVSFDNIEAAYDPSSLGRSKLNIWPQYQFTVKINENTEKSGCVSLVEFKSVESPNKSSTVKMPKNKSAFHETIISNEATELSSSSTYFQRKSIFDQRNNRRLTKTEKLIGLQSKGLNLKALEKRSSKYLASTTTHGILPANGFYKFTHSEARLKPKIIHDFRMNSSQTNSHEIPLLCFQREEIKNKVNYRRVEINGCFRSQNVLNAAAFKGYFCDLLIEKLSEPLNLDFSAVSESSVLEEFLTVNQERTQYYITPVIKIRDWNKYLAINKRVRGIGKTGDLTWPSSYMQKVMNILPCNGVPTGHSHVSEENVDYEKMWKLVFPKTEEFLLLHMMHAHVRCYFFVLLLYKSFIETEINSASLGPKHLMHLLFWRVQRSFLAWPEDKPGETLLSYLNTLYKKLQKKYLSDFFVKSRNLFATSLCKDLHKAQVLVKKIIENPVPYLIRAIRNLHFKSDFYPAIDILKLRNLLRKVNIIEKSKNTKREKKQKMVRFQEEDEEQNWKKTALKQIELERQAEEKENATKLSVDSADVDEILDFNSQDSEKRNQILEIFTCHFIELANKSLDYEFLSQALFYLNQAEKLFDLMILKGKNHYNLKTIEGKINKLKEVCSNKLKQNLKNSPPPKKQSHKSSGEVEKNFEVEKNNMAENQGKRTNMVIKQTNQKYNETSTFHEASIGESEVFSVKL